MIDLRKLVLTVVAHSLLIGAASAAVVDDTVAVVNGQAILLSDFRKEYSTKLREVRQDDPDAVREPGFEKALKQKTLEGMIDRELLSQLAGQEGVRVLDREVDDAVAQMKSGFTEDENGKPLTEEGAQRAFEEELRLEGLDYGQFRDRIRKELLGRKLIEQDVRPTVEAPSAKDVRAYFDRLARYAASASTQPPSGMDAEDAAQFVQIAEQIRHLTAERVRASDILVAIAPDASDKEIERARAKALAIRAEVLAQGTTHFADIARAESEDSATSQDGGDLGVIARGEAAPGFEKALFALGLGELSQPILTGAGWRLVLVQGKSVAEEPRFERFQGRLAEIMTQQAYRKAAREYVREQEGKAVITRRLEAL